MPTTSSVRQRDNHRLRYLTREEEDVLVIASADYLKPIVRLAANTGLRVGEVLDLRWQNADLDNGLLLVARSKSGKRREIPLNDTALALLRNVPRHIRSKFVFCKPDGSQRKTVRSGGRHSLIASTQPRDARPVRVESPILSRKRTLYAPCETLMMDRSVTQDRESDVVELSKRS